MKVLCRIKCNSYMHILFSIFIAKSLNLPFNIGSKCSISPWLWGNWKVEWSFFTWRLTIHASHSHFGIDFAHVVNLINNDNNNIAELARGTGGTRPMHSGVLLHNPIISCKFHVLFPSGLWASHKCGASHLGVHLLLHSPQRHEAEWLHVARVIRSQAGQLT